ncbi:hypothetical protein THASP1DRAFT_32801 [Thamnocephalis sphaerospora]|uniref:Uncharacterized protein n=1 Tax=Thamnocephalis sphaerospora TaxID=78915 RepID=A0A4V1IVV3_9FUNG|nr:hypothetical protein THASP1DRAFT_32801 [Thamnocephalis sphaerospora]|eukprot:RKP05359.1 hypothetical protein THASP1DRAFT_32801 [Thamnocephalis sphaerospora]
MMLVRPVRVATNTAGAPAVGHRTLPNVSPEQHTSPRHVCPLVYTLARAISPIGPASGAGTASSIGVCALVHLRSR